MGVRGRGDAAGVLARRYLACQFGGRTYLSQPNTCTFTLWAWKRWGAVGDRVGDSGLGKAL
jgi:hypothetical protein